MRISFGQRGDEGPMAIADEGDRRIPAATLQERQFKIRRTQGDGLSRIPTLTLSVGVVLDDLLTLREQARTRQHKGFPDDGQT